MPVGSDRCGGEKKTNFCETESLRIVPQTLFTVPHTEPSKAFAQKPISTSSIFLNAVKEVICREISICSHDSKL